MVKNGNGSGALAEDMIAQQLAEIKKFISENPSLLQELINKSGLSPAEVELMLTTERKNITSVIRLNQTVDEMKKEIETQEKIQEIKEFIKPNATIIFDLSTTSGLPPQEVAEILGTKKGSYQKVTCIYDAMQQMLNVKNEEMSSRLSK